MASNYSGNPTGVQAPGVAPGPNVVVVKSIPAGTDPLSIESITQDMKIDADGITWLNQQPKAINCDGFDGAVTLDGVVAAPSWATKVGTVYTMTRDAFPSALTVTGAAVVLKTANFRLICSGTITTAAGGTINNDGAAGSVSTATNTATPAGSLGAGGSGGAGGTVSGAGAAGGNVTNATGGAGGAGGLGPGGAGGGAGTATAPAANLGGYHMWPGPNSSGYVFSWATPGVWNQLQGGAGGGGSGGGSGGGITGNSGGAGGGVMVVMARQFILANATDIHCNGGAGAAGNGGAFSSGGSGGGGGGTLLLCYGTSNQTFTAANCVAGGAGGAIGSGGSAAGAAGANGTLLVFSQG